MPRQPKPKSSPMHPALKKRKPDPTCEHCHGKGRIWYDDAQLSDMRYEGDCYCTRPKSSAAAAKSRKPAKAPTLAQRAKEAREKAEALAGWTNSDNFRSILRKAIRLAVASERERGERREKAAFQQCADFAERVHSNCPVLHHKPNVKETGTHCADHFRMWAHKVGRAAIRTAPKKASREGARKGARKS